MENVRRLVREVLALYIANCEADRAQREYLGKGMDGDYDILCDELSKVTEAERKCFAACDNLTKHDDCDMKEEYCGACREPEHEACSMTDGCPCCDNTRSLIEG